MRSFRRQERGSASAGKVFLFLTQRVWTKAGIMTNQEWESGMNDLRQAQMATQRLIELNIKAFDQRLEKVDQRVDKIDQRLEKLTRTVEKLSDQMLELRAAVASLVTTVDRFIQGGSNGQKGAA